jgi:hypothetical protein
LFINHTKFYFQGSMLWSQFSCRSVLYDTICHSLDWSLFCFLVALCRRTCPNKNFHCTCKQAFTYASFLLAYLYFAT